MSTILLIDGNSLIYRAHYAFINRPLFSNQGFPTSALHGFGNTLLSLLEQYNPQRLLIAFDAGKKTFRHDFYPNYKTGRKPTPEDLIKQMPIIKELLAALGLKSYECPDFEADDIIGTFAQQGYEQGFQVLIASGDRDTFQLINERVKVLYPSPKKRGEMELIDEEKVIELYGVPPKNIPDYKGLAGDNSDAIPGILGFGEKTTKALLSDYKNLEELYSRIMEIPPGKKRDNLILQKEDAFLYRRLGTIIRDMPVNIGLDELVPAPFNREKLEEMLNTYSLRALSAKLSDKLEIANKSGNRVPILEIFDKGENKDNPEPELSDKGEKIMVEKGGKSAEINFSENEESKEKDKKNATIQSESDKNYDPLAKLEINISGKGNYKTIDNIEELEKAIVQIKNAGFLSFDTETTSKDPMDSELVGISLSWKAGEAVYIPVGHQSLFELKQLPKEQVLDRLSRIFQDANIPKYGQNLKYDLLILKNEGISLEGRLFDTMVASYLLNPQALRGHSLDELALRYLDYSPISFNQVVAKGENFAHIPLDRATQYAAEDADIALRLALKLGPKLVEMNLFNLFESLEMPLLPILAEMEYNGIEIDEKSLKELGQQLLHMAQAVEKQIYELVGVEFNINSPKQLSSILFEKIGIKPPKKTKTGFSTSFEVLESLAEEYPIANTILEYRSLMKLKNTYTDSLIALKNKKTGRIHTSFNQTVTATGRLSSSEPNLQNIPIRTELGRLVRQGFVSPAGKYLLSADYSQIELRLMAHFSEDPILLSAFLKGQDIHAETASNIFDIPVEMVNKEQRDMAKTINFGVLYGMNAHKLSRDLKIDIQQASNYIKKFYEKFSGITIFKEMTIEKARQQGYVSTIMGRHRYFPELNSEKANERQAAERGAVNTVIQGSAADLMKKAMIDIWKFLKKKKAKTRLLLQIHDELVFEYPPEEEHLHKDIGLLMEEALPCQVKIVANQKKGVDLANLS